MLVKMKKKREFLGDCQFLKPYNAAAICPREAFPQTGEGGLETHYVTSVNTGLADERMFLLKCDKSPCSFYLHSGNQERTQTS